MKFQLRTYLTLALNGGKKTVSLLACFIWRKSTPATVRTQGMVSTIPGLAAFKIAWNGETVGRETSHDLYRSKNIACSSQGRSISYTVSRFLPFHEEARVDRTLKDSVCSNIFYCIVSKLTYVPALVLRNISLPEKLCEDQNGVNQRLISYKTL